MLLCLAAGLLAACGGEQGTTTSTGGAAASTSSAAPAVAPTGTIIEITMHTDESGNYFKPARIEARTGDVLRFKLATGVHNVNFLPDSNPGARGLPASPSAYLQLPGQKMDIPVTWGAGDYFFQCDPHAMLGMVGRLTVN
jgi:plastocyanin